MSEEGGEEGGEGEGPGAKIEDPISESVEDLGAAPEPQASSAAQRLRIHVPNVKTTVSLGAKGPGAAIRPEDTGALNYAGFGVHTLGHAFVDVAETTTLQSKESTTVQTQGALAMGGREGVVLGSAEAIVLGGGGGVAILGGYPAEFPEHPPSDAEEPKPPGWVAPISHGSAAVTGVVAAIDAFMGLKDGFHALKERYGKKKKKAPWPKLVGAGLASLGGISSSVATLGAINSAWPKNHSMKKLEAFLGGTLVYGEGGLLGATPMAMGLYSLFGTVIGSTGNIAVKGLNSELTGMFSAEVAAKNVEIKATHELEMVAAGEVAVASRKEGLCLLGKEVVIGTNKAAGEQAETESIQMYAKDSIDIASREYVIVSANRVATVALEAATTAESMSVSALKKISYGAPDIGITAKDNLSLSTAKYMVNIGSDSLKLGNVASPLPDPPAPPSTAEIADAMAALYSGDSDARESAKAKAKKHFDEVAAWRDKIGEVEYKNCSIELKDGDILMTVHDFKFKIDSSKTSVGGSLTVMKS